MAAAASGSTVSSTCGDGISEGRWGNDSTASAGCDAVWKFHNLKSNSEGFVVWREDSLVAGVNVSLYGGIVDMLWSSGAILEIRRLGSFVVCCKGADAKSGDVIGLDTFKAVGEVLGIC